MYYENSDEAFAALNTGDVDAVGMGSLSAIQGYKVVSRIASDPFYFMTGKDNADLINSIDEAMLEILIKDPYYSQKLFDKYYRKADSVSYLGLTREETQFVQNSGEITIAFVPNRFPYSDADSEGNITGIIPDIFNLISEKSGLKFRYVMMNAGVSTVNYLGENNTQLVAGVLSNSSVLQSRTYSLSDTFVSGNVGLVCKEGKSYDISSDNNYTIAIPASYQSLQSELSQKYPGFKQVLYTTTKQCLEAVKSGEADIAAQNIDILSNIMQDPHYDGLKMLSTVIMEEPMSVVGLSNDTNDAIVSIIDKTITTISDSQIEQLVIGYTSRNTYTMSFMDFVYKYYAAFTVIGILLLIIIVALLGMLAMKHRYYHNLALTNGQLEEAVESANNANMAKSTFLSQMSHDMRTPMNGILGIAYLSKDESDVNVLKNNISRIEQSGQLLLSLINDTLEMSRIESGKTELKPSECNERKLFESIISIVRPQIMEKNIDLSVKYIGINNTTICVDRQRFQQIFINILSNAIKFTAYGGNIDVVVECLKQDNDFVRNKFIIKDNGIGMSEDFQERMFEPFEQERRIYTTSKPGTGLGLSIVKKLVELMDGELSIKSKSGVGTEVTIYMNLPVFKQKTSGENEPVNVIGDFLVGKRILLCEDNYINTEVAKRLLEKMGCIVETEENGKLGVERFADSNKDYYDVILMDIRMPVMDGLEATKTIRELNHPNAKSIPIIAMSANAFDEDIEKSMKAGMNAHVSKPVIPEKLYKVIEENIHKES